MPQILENTVTIKNTKFIKKKNLTIERKFIFHAATQKRNKYNKYVRSCTLVQVYKISGLNNMTIRVFFIGIE